MNGEDIVYADKSYRKKIVIALILSALAGTILLHYTKEYIDHVSRGQSLDHQYQAIEHMMSLIKVMKVAALTVFAIAGIYWISLGYRILKYNRFPPPGMKVVRDTKMRKGSSAKMMAYGLFAGAVLLLTLPNITFWYMQKVFDNMTSTRHEVSEVPDP